MKHYMSPRFILTEGNILLQIFYCHIERQMLCFREELELIKDFHTGSLSNLAISLTGQTWES